MPGIRELRFVHVDVFAERALAGNPLAVFFDADGLDGATMQAIARELNLSETVFLLTPRRPDCAARIRIFTPGRELPFAGHPTIGTAWVLSREGLVPPGDRFTIEEEIGPVEVSVEGDPRAPGFIWMKHRDATFEPPVRDRDGVAAALGLKPDDLLGSVPIEVGSTGNPFLYVPLRDAATVDRAGLDPRRLDEAAPAVAAAGLGLYVLAPHGAGRLYTRMFAPAHGVAEDPATGSAAGALGAYAVRHGLVEARGESRLVAEQGTKMGHQSFLHIALLADAAGVRDLRVGGAVVPLIDGRLRLPLP
ncbi:MAG: PhzF family phenazine biosynthesis protein [Candidatus Rokubacteria bacterium]|nr:PhzF family phenazine biosynthesis protein [Candidatus Rokubacteria bacterium]